MSKEAQSTRIIACAVVPDLTVAFRLDPIQSGLVTATEEALERVAFVGLGAVTEVTERRRPVVASQSCRRLWGQGTVMDSVS